MSTANKLTYLNGTKQAIKQAINEDFEVIDNNTTFREYADEISSNNAKYKDLIPKETKNATNTLDISNSAGLDKALVTQYGNTYQEGEPTPDYPQEIQVVTGDNEIDICGKNIINIPNRTYTNSTISVVANDGVLTINGINSTTGNIIVEFTGINNYTTNQNITMVRNGDDISDGNAQLFLTVDGTEYNMGNQTSHPDWRTLSYSGTITRLRLRIAPGASYTNFKIKPMLYLGDYDSSILFEPYKGASYPINLGNIELCKIGNYKDYIRKSTGKNLFAYGTTAIDKTATYRTNQYQRLLLTATANPNEVKFNYNGNYCMGYIEMNGIDGTLPYKISFSIKENTTDYTPTCAIDTTNSTNQKLVIIINGNNKGTSTSSRNYFILTNIQVESGSTITQYEPYGKVWYLNKQIGKVVLNGSETGWFLKDTYNSINQFQVKREDALYINDDYSRVLSNYYKGTKYSMSWTIDNFITIASGSRNNQIRIMTSQIDSVENFKTWLSTHNTTVYYVLATPITTEITDSNYPTLYNQLNNIKLFEGVNHITMTNESGLDVEFGITYYKDWKLD